MENVCIQDQLQPSWHRCFGCGRDNGAGLKIRSFWDGDDIVCTWQPGEHPEMQGADNILNGGVAATLIDCHTAAAAMAHLHRQEGQPIGSEPVIEVVTGSLNVDFLKPVFMDRPLHMRASLVRQEGRKLWVDCMLRSGKTDAVRGEALYIRVAGRPAPPPQD